MRIIVNNLVASERGAVSVLKSVYRYVRENDKANEYVFRLNNHYLEKQIETVQKTHI